MRFDFRNYISVIKALKRNKMRSFLTSLGIIIGISAVIIIMSVGSGAHSLIANEIQGVGSDLIGVLPGASDDDGPPAAIMGINITTLTLDDAKAVEKDVEEIIGVTAYVRGSATVTWQNKVADTSFAGVTANYMDVESGADVELGRFIGKEEADSITKVAVLGSSVAEELFGPMDPIDERIKINKESFRVIGLMKERGSASFQDQDDQIFISITTAQKLMLGINYISMMRAKVIKGADVEFVQEKIKSTLREQHDIDDPSEDDFTVQSSEESLEMLESITGALNYFLAMVAAISLLVGGIGIMNIMLVSVTESTREIGLRKAVGATSSNISNHFLIQTIMLTSMGGLIGIILGVLVAFIISLIVNSLGYNWDFVISATSIIIAVVFTIVVGLSFGWYPARKAAKLNPIEALRYE
ncbi:FtsX-like permease family protein [Candidatus Parcubacteria bacterium]|jgi:putative ABC transport system permease protein|nr:FtsX-like permease family protein [Candidatus Parcubacteria bacterium]